MARFATASLVLGLLGGTAAAFAVTEGLKLEKSHVSGVRVETFEFGPSCDCATRKAHFSIRLRKSDRAACQRRLHDRGGPQMTPAEPRKVGQPANDLAGR